MMKILKRQLGFTLIELVVAMVILAVIALIAIPKFTDLSDQGKIAATQGELGALRSTLKIKYAESAASGNSNPTYPAALVAADFGNNRLPVNHMTGLSAIGTVAAPPSGTATHATNGFWYMTPTGEAGAYSDGAVDTSGW